MSTPTSIVVVQPQDVDWLVSAVELNVFKAKFKLLRRRMDTRVIAVRQFGGVLFHRMLRRRAFEPSASATGWRQKPLRARMYSLLSGSIG